MKIGEFAMPWETHDKITSVPKGYVKWYEWAYRTEGIKQVGCIYTAQGFEFDYIGVIIGNDLRVDRASGKISADISATKDPMLKRNADNFEKHVKNIYRTLLTRGMKGCYVYFTDRRLKSISGRGWRQWSRKVYALNNLDYYTGFPDLITLYN